MTQQDLIDFQNEGFVSIYSAPWRCVPMLKKHGIIGGLLMLMRVFKLAIRKTTGKASLLSQSSKDVSKEAKSNQNTAGSTV